MALKIDYVVRETGSNLRRNFTLTAAAVMTVMVCLALLGLALLTRSGVDNATAQWQGGVEFIVFMEPDVNESQTAAIERKLARHPQIERVTFYDQDDAYQEFQELFAGTQEMVDVVTPEILPPSYRVVPAETDAEFVEGLAEQFRVDAGVKRVVLASEAIRLIEDFSRVVSVVVLVIFLLMLGVSILLILNTIRMAIFARRRDVEVMKLVGATNWFIRVPFMLEGLFQGLVGSGLAIGFVWFINWLLKGLVERREDIPLVASFVADNADIWQTSVILLIIGSFMGVVGSGFAVSRFLDV